MSLQAWLVHPPLLRGVLDNYGSGTYPKIRAEYDSNFCYQGAIKDHQVRGGAQGHKKLAVKRG